MLKLNLKNAPYDLEVAPGVVFQVEPATTTLMLEMFADAPEREDDGGESHLNFAKRMARRVVLDWQGVCDENGKPVKVSDALIDAALDAYPIFTGFQKLYVNPALVLGDEGNALPASLTGTSGAGGNTAAGAKPRAKRALRKNTPRKPVKGRVSGS